MRTSVRLEPRIVPPDAPTGAVDGPGERSA